MQKSDRVTNARGWHGIIQDIKTGKQFAGTPDGKYYLVWWEERANHDGDPFSATIRKHPICGHTCNQIWRSN